MGFDLLKKLEIIYNVCIFAVQINANLAKGIVFAILKLIKIIK